jgi:hypothetical protein
MATQALLNEAQVQLVRADLQIDCSALKYLQQSPGHRRYRSRRTFIRIPSCKRMLPLKNRWPVSFWLMSAPMPSQQLLSTGHQRSRSTKSHRSNLIEDLNEDGFADPRNLTANDLPLIQNRIALIEQLAPNAMDQVNAAAFKEAYKDLVNMRAKLRANRLPADNQQRSSRPQSSPMWLTSSAIML